jgi:predicted nucleic acid-binding protein
MKDEKTFLDTNILVYAHDKTSGRKHKISRGIVMDLWNTGSGILSVQVLQELYIILTKKIPVLVKPAIAKEIISSLSKWELVINDADSILSAIEIQQKYRYSFWDSLIIDAAIRGGATILFSEDMKDGDIIKNVTIRNPFL